MHQFLPHNLNTKLPKIIFWNIFMLTGLFLFGGENSFLVSTFEAHVKAIVWWWEFIFFFNCFWFPLFNDQHHFKLTGWFCNFLKFYMNYLTCSILFTGLWILHYWFFLGETHTHTHTHTHTYIYIYIYIFAWELQFPLGAQVAFFVPLD